MTADYLDTSPEQDELTRAGAAAIRERFAAAAGPELPDLEPEPGPHQIAPDAAASLFTPGDRFLRDVPAEPEPIWGSGSEVLASRGETCIITGPIGAGKTSINSGLVRGSIGATPTFLGYPVEQCDRVLYLACDRPRQIARNLRRSIDPDTPHLGERLTFWGGPPPRDLAKNPHVLLAMADRAGLKPGDRIFIDGLKDVAAKLADEETGGGLNTALQLVLARGIDVFANHHQRKAQGGKNGGRPRSLDDVYGSTWISAGAGTVLLLWADKPGSTFVDLETLKPAGEHVGPLPIVHDLERGVMTVADQVTIEDVLQAAPGWHALADIAAAMGLDSDDRNGRERVRRRIRKLVELGHVEVKKVPSDGGGRDSDYCLWVGGR